MVGGGKAGQGSRWPGCVHRRRKARTKQAELSAIRSGIIAPTEPEQAARERTTVADALDKYSEYIRYHRSLRTFRTCRPILASFNTFCAKTYIDEIERADLVDFATHRLKQSQKARAFTTSWSWCARY